MNLAVIFAGGMGVRMNSKAKPKQFLTMHGVPVIIHTLEVFENHPEIDGIVISCLEGWIEYLKNLIEKYHLRKVKKIVPGGRTGQLSIYEGLKAARELAGDENAVVLVHDGVRPLITETVITDNIRCVREHGSAITSVKVKETIMEVDDEGRILYIPDRAHSRLARAPQSFWLQDIYKTHLQALREGKTDFIDSCSMMKHYGKKMYLIDGPQENIKITTPDDFYIMRALLDARENSQIYGMEGMKGMEVMEESMTEQEGFEKGRGN